MKKLILTLITIITFMAGSNDAAAKRQDTTNIKGIVYEQSSGEPLGFATVAVMAADSSIVAGATCELDGTYLIEGVAPGEYTLTVSMVGYRSVSSSITVARSTLEVSPVYLFDDVEMLQGAVVTEKVKLIENKIDKVVMNVSQSAFAQGSNALELLRKAPGVTIDKDGNIKLNGKSVSIWIDGRPSYMDGRALEALLRATDGGTIDKFEIMEHPSAKYDAEGQGGIINIKTKKTILSGLNGSLGFDGGGMSFKEPDYLTKQFSSWANLHYRTAKAHTFVNLNGGLYDMGQVETMDNVLDTPAGELRSTTDALMKIKEKSVQVKAGNDWFIDKKNTLGIIVSAPFSNGSVSQDRDYCSSDVFLNGNLIEKTVSDIRQPVKFKRITGNVNYTHIFDEARSAEITTNLDWYHTVNNNQTHADNYITGPSSAAAALSRRDINLDNISDIYSFKSDYQSVLWQSVMFEAGVKWATSITDYDMKHTETGLPDMNNFFTYREHIGAAYFDFARSLGTKVSLKAGLRGEYTDSFGDWKSDGKTTSRKYFSLFPTVFVGYMPGEKANFAFSYTRRIHRPNYGYLNPARTYMDAHSYVIGNADLQPEFTNEIAVQGTFWQYLSLALVWQRTTDMINQVPSFDEMGYEVILWDNDGCYTQKVVSLNVSSLPLAKWLNWSLNAFYLNMNNELAGYTNKSNGLHGSTTFSFVLPHDWKVELNGQCNSTISFGYFKVHPMWQSNLGVKKNMLDGRLSLTLNVDDIFNSARNDIEVVGVPGTRSSYIGQQALTRMVRIGLNWNFGKSQQTRQRNVGNIDEASRLDSSASIGK